VIGETVGLEFEFSIVRCAALNWWTERGEEVEEILNRYPFF
jgi:hypothetical protein